MTQSPSLHQDLARRIDLACTTGDAQALSELDRECSDLIASGKPQEKARLWYFRSNISAALQDENPRAWDWRQPYREKQVLYLRRALESDGSGEFDPLLRAQIHTNLANQLNHFGRPIEAIREFDKALLNVPNFAMALVNRGLARETLARMQYDRGHSALIAYFAHCDYSLIVDGPTIWDGHYYGIYEEVKNLKLTLERIFDIKQIKNMLETSKYSLGKTKQEQTYRSWVLKKGLYLNPLTSIGPFSIGANDILHMPPHKAKDISETPHFISWFNQLKQEFIAARFFFFESKNTHKPHFADSETHLIDTLDAPLHSIQIERMRSSYRIAYGILDKIAGFINAYFSLGEKPDSVSFKTIWLTKDRKDIRPEFKNRANLALTGC